MTDIPDQSNRLDRIEALLERVSVRLDDLSYRQANTQRQLQLENFCVKRPLLYVPSFASPIPPP